MLVVTCKTVLAYGIVSGRNVWSDSTDLAAQLFRTVVGLAKLLVGAGLLTSFHFGIVKWVIAGCGAFEVINGLLLLTAGGAAQVKAKPS